MTLRIKGNLSSLSDPVAVHARRSAIGANQRKAARRRAQGIDSNFRGNAKAALSVTVTASGLGASPRKGWRLSGENGKNARHNTAGYIAVGDLATYVKRDAPKGTPAIDGVDGIPLHLREHQDHIVARREAAHRATQTVITYDA